MNYRKQLAAAMAAGGLILGMLSMSASVVLADGSIPWGGQGVTNGELNSVDCDASAGAAYLYWVFAGAGDGVTSATMHFGGDPADYPMNPDNGQWKLQNGPWFDLATLTAWVTFTGEPDGGNPHPTISHGCPGETTTTTTTTEATTTTTEATTTTTEATTTTTEETTTTTEETTTEETTTEETTTTTTFTGGTGPATDIPTEPNTATIGTGGPGTPGGGSWLLLLALGLLLGSVVILTPAKAKNRS